MYYILYCYVRYMFEKKNTVIKLENNLRTCGLELTFQLKPDHKNYTFIMRILYIFQQTMLSSSALTVDKKKTKTKYLSYIDQVSVQRACAYITYIKLIVRYDRKHGIFLSFKQFYTSEQTDKMLSKKLKHRFSGKREYSSLNMYLYIIGYTYTLYNVIRAVL